MTDRRRLIVMRHAKAEPFAESDHARELTERGVAAAHDVGTRLREAGLRPDHAVVSSATRTRQTWAAVAESAGLADCAVSFDDAVFNGSVETVMEVLAALPEDAETVVFVGHNPTAAYLCHLLDDGDGDPEAVSGLLQGFPPGALAVLELSVPWTDLDAETGRVVGFHVGQG